MECFEIEKSIYIDLSDSENTVMPIYENESFFYVAKISLTEKQLKKASEFFPITKNISIPTNVDNLL